MNPYHKNYDQIRDIALVLAELRSYSATNNPEDLDRAYLASYYVKGLQWRALLRELVLGKVTLADVTVQLTEELKRLKEGK